MRMARHAPAGRTVPLPRLLGRRANDVPAWHGMERRYFNSGTAALSVALRRASAALPAGTTARVALPAYACPNLLASVRWAGAEPVYYDLNAESLAGEAGVLKRWLAAPDVLVVHVDAFGAPSLPEPIGGPRVIHDLAQSYAPYELNWRARAPYSILSFGRAKPLSLTLGGALLTTSAMTGSAVQDTSDTKGMQPGPDRARIAGRAAAYALSLHPMVFGLLARIPQLGIGQTHLRALKRVELWPDSFDALVQAAISSLRLNMGRWLEDTQAMLRLVQESGGEVPSGVARAASTLPLWRVPILCPTAQGAATLSQEGAHLGISRLYGCTIPQMAGTAEREVAERWPVATSIAARLVTLPTHGRLSPRAHEQLRRLLGKIFR